MSTVVAPLGAPKADPRATEPPTDAKFSKPPGTTGAPDRLVSAADEGGRRTPKRSDSSCGICSCITHLWNCVIGLISWIFCCCSGSQAKATADNPDRRKVKAFLDKYYPGTQPSAAINNRPAFIRDFLGLPIVAVSHVRQAVYQAHENRIALPEEGKAPERDQATDLFIQNHPTDRMFINTLFELMQRL